VVEIVAAESAAQVLRECVRSNAENLIAWIVHQEFERFRRQFLDDEGSPTIVRNGFQPARSIMTGLGQLTVRYPKARSKAGMPVSFRSQLIPKYLHRAHDEFEDAHWGCLDAMRSESLSHLLHAVFGDRSDLVRRVLPEVMSKWVELIREWKTRSLSEYCNQDLWMLTVCRRTDLSTGKGPLHVAIAGADSGPRNILCVAGGGADSSVDARNELVESIQRRGMSNPGRIYSSWDLIFLSDSLKHLVPQWTERLVQVGLHAGEGSGRMAGQEDAPRRPWPELIHQN
jgi:putative transposase